MGSLKTLARVAGVLGLLTQVPAAFADDPATLRLFAHCTGRLSAVMEDQWLSDGPASERTKAMRDAMASLAEAAMRPDERAQAMGWRVSAKAAQAALLAVARFGDPVPARRARQRSTVLMGECNRLLLGS